MTVLLHDEDIDEFFVCKKFEPTPGLDRATLWKNFIREIKILYKMFHKNIVRIYGCHLYAEQYAGFILMEYVNGQDIEGFAKSRPELIDELFQQAVSGFSYLHAQEVLHRDIRMSNLLVNNNGLLKVIDFGFGKEVNSFSDFDKSISLSAWCKPPKEFKERRYDYRTEVYFVGRLFRKLLQDNCIQDFRFELILESMCKYDPSERIETFAKVEQELASGHKLGNRFSEEQIDVYRRFADVIVDQIVSVSHDSKYKEDSSQILSELQSLHYGFSLEEYLPDARQLFSCFVIGDFRYRSGNGRSIETELVKNFTDLFSSVSEGHRRQILANLHQKFDQLKSHADEPIPDDDIPF